MAKVINFPQGENQIKNETTGSMFEFGGLPIDAITGKVVKKELDTNALYAVNWNKLEKVEDLILILASIGFVFGTQHAHFNTIKHLLDTDNPIYPQQQPQ